MGTDTDANIQKEIIERALAKEKEKAAAAGTSDTLDTLEKMTDLPRGELEKIAADVERSSVADKDTFFSIKTQIILAVSFIAVLIVCYFLIKWLF